MASKLDNVISLSKRRGFVYQCGEIYGGTKSAWDYGPLGVELKDNIKRQWWRSMVQSRDDVVGLDSSVILPTAVWTASGHLAAFVDPLVECQSCHKRYRQDHLQEAYAEKKAKKEGSSADPDAVGMELIVCANCGTRTAMKEGGWKRDCPQCKAEHFPRTDPVVIMLVTAGDKCLLGRQAIFLPTMWSCLAGLVEAGAGMIDDGVGQQVDEGRIHVGAHDKGDGRRQQRDVGRRPHRGCQWAPRQAQRAGHPAGPRHPRAVAGGGGVGQTAVDATGAHNGVYTTTGVTGNRPGAIVGDVNKSVDFAGGEVTVAHGGALAASGTALTVEAWAQIDTIGAARRRMPQGRDTRERPAVSLAKYQRGASRRSRKGVWRPDRRPREVTVVLTISCGVRAGFFRI